MVDISRLLSVALATVLVAALAVAMMTPAVQFAYYLYSGNWYPVSCLQPLIWADSVWAQDPQSWLGVHSIMNWMHLSAGCFFLIVVLFLPLAYFNEVVEAYEWEEAKKRVRQDEKH